MRSLKTSAKLLGIVAALAAHLASGAPASARAAKHSRCSAAGHRVLATKGSVLVYERLTATPDSSGGSEDGVFACIRRNGASHLLGLDDLQGQDSVYGPDSSFLGDVSVAGSFVAGQFVTGADAQLECSKYMPPSPPPCPTPITTIHIATANSGRSASIPLTSAQGGEATLVISSAGGIAWVDAGLYAAHLTPSGARGLGHQATLVDSGPIDPTSLSLRGMTLQWVDNGQSHSSVIP